MILPEKTVESQIDASKRQKLRLMLAHLRIFHRRNYQDAHAVPSISILFQENAPGVIGPLGEPLIESSRRWRLNLKRGSWKTNVDVDKPAASLGPPLFCTLVPSFFRSARLPSRLLRVVLPKCTAMETAASVSTIHTFPKKGKYKI